MKKVLAAVFVLGLFANSVLADAGFFASICTNGESDNFRQFDAMDYSRVGGSGSLGMQMASENSPIFIKFGAFYEQTQMFNLSEKSILGISAGYQSVNGKSFTYSIQDSVYDFSYRLSVEGYKIPVLVYYKYQLSPRFFVKSGIGAIYVSSQWGREYNDSSTSKNEGFIMPQIDGGFDLKLSKIFTLALDLSYSFNGKKQSPYSLTAFENFKAEKDFSGFSAEFALKVYVI